MSRLDDVGYPNWTWIDKGVNGEESWNAADDVYTLSTRRFRNWLESGYAQGEDDVFVFMWGTNDVRKTGWPDGVPPNAAVTQASLEQIVDDALALGVPAVLAVPPLFAAGGSHTQEEVDVFNANIARRRQIVQEIVAARAGEPIVVADIATPWASLEDFPHLDYYRRADGVADGVHPGTQVAPSGYCGRYHLGEAISPAIVAAIALNTPAPVPGLRPAALMGLVSLLITLGLRALAAGSRRR